MPSRSTGSSSPTASASSAEPSSEACDRIDREGQVLEAGGDDLFRGALGRDLLDLVDHGRLCGGGIGLDRLDRIDEPDEDRLHQVGVLLEELGAHDDVGRDVLAAGVGPQVALVDEDRAAAFEDQPGRPRLGNPGAVDRRRRGTTRAWSSWTAAGSTRRRRPRAWSRSPARPARPAARRPGCCRATAWRASCRRVARAS